MISTNLKFCLVVLVFFFGTPKEGTAAGAEDNDFQTIEITVTRVANFSDDVERYLKAITRMIPVRLIELDPDDPNLTHVKGNVRVRFREAGDPLRLSDNLSLALSTALEEIAGQRRPLAGAYYSIPNFEVIPPNVDPASVSYSPARITTHLDAIDYRKHHALNRREKDCRRTLIEVTKQDSDR